MKFRTDVAGFVTGIRFYKGTANTGTHVGTLWSGTGTKLATATFTGETATGWQKVNLPRAGRRHGEHHLRRVVLRPGRSVRRRPTTASRSAVTSGPLTALANGTERRQRRLPVRRRRVPDQHLPGQQLLGRRRLRHQRRRHHPADGDRPHAGAQRDRRGDHRRRSPRPSASRSRRRAIAFTLTGPGGAVAGQRRVRRRRRSTATLTPTAALAANTTYTASVSGAQDAAGNTMAPVSWSFTTGGASPPPLDSGPGGPIVVVKNPSAPEASSPRSRPRSCGPRG